MRTLIGLLIGIILFLGIPVLQSVNDHFGYYTPFSYQDVVLGLLLIVGCIIAAQLTGLKPPRKDDRE